jgi:DNA-binding PadR family transcriptional regulator
MKKPGDKSSENKLRMAASGRKTSAPKRIKASLELALLGLIAELHLPSGYDLVQTFRLSMVHYWHAHPGQIYPTLERMERDGWIAGREVIQRGRPNKRVYSITPQGQRTLLEWLESAYEPFKMKNPPLLRTRFLGHLGADSAREKILESRRAMEEYLELLRGYDRKFAESGGAYHDVNMMFVYFTLRRGIEFARCEIEFCDWAVKELDRNRELFDGSDAASSQVTTEPQVKATSRSRAS